jgi:chromate transporter
MVTLFVGFFGGWTQAGTGDPLLNGVLGGLVTAYVTFLPSFLFIFLGAPYVERLAAARRLQAALVGVTAAVVGVILNLGVFFGARVLVEGTGRLDRFAVLAALVSFGVLRLTRLPVAALVAGGALAGAIRSVWG